MNYFVLNSICQPKNACFRVQLFHPETMRGRTSVRRFTKKTHDSAIQTCIVLHMALSSFRSDQHSRPCQVNAWRNCTSGGLCFPQCASADLHLLLHPITARDPKVRRGSAEGVTLEALGMCFRFRFLASGRYGRKKGRRFRL